MFEDLTKAIETIERQYKIGIDYGSQKDMTAVCLLGEQAEVVIKALAEYMELAKAKAEGRLVAVVHGRWISQRRCSVCENMYFGYDDPIKKFKYCPNCGAKMSKEEAEEALEVGK